jgi:hypothetical protein
VESCRMNGNVPPFCPVCYTSIKTARDHETGHHFRNAHAGRFYGSGRSDLLLHHGTSIQLHRADGTALTHAFSAVEGVPCGSSCPTTRCTSATSTATAPTSW